MRRIDFIKETVAKEFHVTVKDIDSNMRMFTVSQARHMAMYMTHKMLDFSLYRTAKEFNKKDHTTIMNAIARVEHFMSIDSDYKKITDRVFDEINEYLCGIDHELIKLEKERDELKKKIDRLDKYIRSI
jgi:chromosomal replication initiation ATPase DnaA